MELYIIIGSLVGIVAIFLIVMSIRDRKKVKAEKIEKDIIEEKRTLSKDNLLVYLNEVINANNKLLKNFVPSIGKLKMGDIRNNAKKALKDFQKSEEYKFAADGYDNKDIILIYKKFESENSNVWDKKLSDEIKNIKSSLKDIDPDFKKEYTVVAKKLVKEAYK